MAIIGLIHCLRIEKSSSWELPTVLVILAYFQSAAFCFAEVSLTCCQHDGLYEVVVGLFKPLVGQSSVIHTQKCCTMVSSITYYLNSRTSWVKVILESMTLVQYQQVPEPYQPLRG